MAPRQLVDTIGGEEEDRPLAKVGRNMAEKLQTGGIGPVQILEQHQDGAGGAELGEEAADFGEEGGLIGDALQDTPGEGHGRGGERGVGGIGGHQVEPGTVRRSVGQVVAVPGQHAAAACRGVAGKVPGQRRLADAGFTTEEDEPAVT